MVILSQIYCMPLSAPYATKTLSQIITQFTQQLNVFCLFITKLHIYCYLSNSSATYAFLVYVEYDQTKLSWIKAANCKAFAWLLASPFVCGSNFNSQIQQQPREKAGYLEAPDSVHRLSLCITNWLTLRLNIVPTMTIHQKIANPYVWTKMLERTRQIKEKLLFLLCLLPLIV